MPNRSRVEKYAELRKRIDNLDVYTFDDPAVTTKTQFESNSFQAPVQEQPMSTAEVQEAHIKKNTLSLSIDELIKQHEEYTRTIAKAEIDKKYKDMKKEGRIERTKKWVRSTTTLFWFALIAVALALAVVLGLLFGGVIG